MKAAALYADRVKKSQDAEDRILALIDKGKLSRPPFIIRPKKLEAQHG